MAFTEAIPGAEEIIIDTFLIFSDSPGNLSRASKPLSCEAALAASLRHKSLLQCINIGQTTCWRIDKPPLSWDARWLCLERAGLLGRHVALKASWHRRHRRTRPTIACRLRVTRESCLLRLHTLLVLKAL